jgi:crossover junction endodeoxyribonuclease RuvC
VLRVLGIDPGLTRCGVGVVDVAPDRSATLVHVSVIRTGAEEPIEVRLLTVARGIAAALDAYRPDALAVERMFAQHNLRTVIGTAQASGVALAAAAERGLPVGLHTPSEVKAAITGYGNAQKAQVGAMVARVLGLASVPKPADAADALALAICHAWRGPLSRSSSRGAAYRDLTDANEGLDTPARPATRPAQQETPAQRAWRRAEAAGRS